VVVPTGAAAAVAGAPGMPGAPARAQEVQHSGAANIDPNANVVITLKCQGCGAEVVINTNESNYARCHWCRQFLSLENQIPNGAIPDVLLPFQLSKEQARSSIDTFVKKRSFFANKRFKIEFTSENVVGVFFPYFVIDANTHGTFHGGAGKVARTYKRKVGNEEQTFYDIDLYNIGRDFDLAVSGLTVEASSERRDVVSKENTNNIINTVMPFDIENAVAYNGHFLKGFTSERRDSNIDAVRGLVDVQMQDIARFQANSTAKLYDAGIRWDSEKLDTRGISWRSAYLPIWLYSYLEVKKDQKKLLHYVAVNARTGETMGSVPLDKGRLFLVATIIELICVGVGLLLMMLG
ncbi:MAG: hypothetical protein FWE65_03890, partial [Eggerthellaceae bacterium]|nr:hypothetical protein [Eggerthellaceae bacterium]